MSKKIQLALRSYNNPACSTIDEFREDYRKASHVKRLMNDHRRKGKDLNIKLIVNHIISVYNVFDPDFAYSHLVATVAQENYVTLNTFLYFLKMTFDMVDINEEMLAQIKEEMSK